MKKTLKVLTVMVLTAILLFAVSGCRVDIDGRHKGFSKGFNYTGPRYSEIMYAVKSDKKEFNVDNVTLDFYCGWFREMTSWQSDDAIEQLTCMAFYVTPRGSDGVLFVIDPQDNYRNVENQYLISEIPANEFISESFRASQTKRKGKNFTHNGESVTISKEVFSQQQGTLELYVQLISFSQEDELFYFDYGFSLSYSLKIQYKYINDNTVRLS